MRDLPLRRYSGHPTTIQERWIYFFWGGVGGGREEGGKFRAVILVVKAPLVHQLAQCIKFDISPHPGDQELSATKRRLAEVITGL